MFGTERSPNAVCRIADAVPFDEFPRHRRQHVIVLIDALQSLASELAFHSECYEEFLPHEAQARCLHGPFRAKKLHAHGSALSDSPGPAAGLPQGVQRVSRLVENDGRKVQKIKTGLHQLGMADHHLHTVFHLSGVPGFALRGINACSQNRGVDSLIA